MSNKKAESRKALPFYLSTSFGPLRLDIELSFSYIQLTLRQVLI